MKPPVRWYPTWLQVIANRVWMAGVIGAIALIFTVLLVRAQAPDVQQHTDYSRALVELSEVDARLNQAILQVRYGLVNNYDPLVQELMKQKLLQQQLAIVPTFISAQGRQEIQRLLQAHVLTLQGKEQRIEEFKSYNAILKNSLAYFPIAMTEVIQQAAGSSWITPLNTLLRDVLVYNLSASEALHDPIQQEILTLEQQRAILPAAWSGELDNAILHARLILLKKSRIYNLVDRILNTRMLQHTEDLSLAYNQHYQNALQRTNGYRFWLYLLSVFLTIGVAAVIIMQLRQGAIALQREQERAERLLLNILPATIAQRLKQNQECIAESFPEVTVLFADIVGFTQLAGQLPPTKLVTLLNSIFSAFDRLTERYGLEKIKTIGDAYMVVGGLPTPRPDHAAAIAAIALEMQAEIDRFNQDYQQAFQIRIGINTGPVVAGVIGIKKFIYDLWGDTVNIASRMESQGIAGCIQVTEATYVRLKHQFRFDERGIISVKGKGNMITYLLLGK